MFFEIKCDVTGGLKLTLFGSQTRKKEKVLCSVFIFLVIYKNVLHKFSVFNYILNVVLLRRITSVHTLNQFSFGNHKLNQSMNNAIHHAKSETIESFCHV